MVVETTVAVEPINLVEPLFGSQSVAYWSLWWSLPWLWESGSASTTGVFTTLTESATGIAVITGRAHQYYSVALTKKNTTTTTVIGIRLYFITTIQLTPNNWLCLLEHVLV